MAHDSKTLDSLTHPSFWDLTTSMIREGVCLYFDPLISLGTAIQKFLGQIRISDSNPARLAEALLDSLLLQPLSHKAYYDVLAGLDRKRLYTLWRWLELSRESPELRARVAEALATSLASLGDLAAAKKLATEALVHFEAAGKRWQTADVLEELAQIYTKEHSFEKAEQLLERALELYKDVQNKRAMAAAYASNGAIYARLQKYEKAENYLYKALDLYKEMQDQSGIAMAYMRLALMFEEMREFSRAAECYNNAALVLSRLERETGGSSRTDYRLSRRPRAEDILKLVAVLSHLAAEKGRRAEQTSS